MKQRLKIDRMVRCRISLEIYRQKKVGCFVGIDKDIRFAKAQPQRKAWIGQPVTEWYIRPARLNAGRLDNEGRALLA